MFFIQFSLQTENFHCLKPLVGTDAIVPKDASGNRFHEFLQDIEG